MTDTLERTPGQWTTPTPTTGEQMLDYTRRIHWWVRLFGVLTLIGMALWMVTVMYFVGRGVATRADASSTTTVTTSTSHGSYDGCISQGYDVATCTRIYG